MKIIKKLLPAFDEAYNAGKLEGTLHHWGLTSMKEAGWLSVDEIKKKYLDNWHLRQFN